MRRSRGRVCVCRLLSYHHPLVATRAPLAPHGHLGRCSSLSLCLPPLNPPPKRPSSRHTRACLLLLRASSSVPSSSSSGRDSRCRLCKTPCYLDLTSEAGESLSPQLLQQTDFDGAVWQSKVWRAAAERETDGYVQCDTCDRWHHHICACFPAPEMLPDHYGLEGEGDNNAPFSCPRCVADGTAARTPPTAALRSLQTRTAASLPTSRLSRAIEAGLADEIARQGAPPLAGRVYIRPASRTRQTLAAAFLKERYVHSRMLAISPACMPTCHL